MLWYGDEVAAARAAVAVGIPYTLSTASIAPLEDVAREAGGDLWFQLYAWPQLSLAEELVLRAKAAGYRVLIVTADVPVASNRGYNLRNGFSVPFKFTPRNVLDAIAHPRWFAGVMGRHMLAGGIPEFANMPASLRTNLRCRGRRATLPPNASITREVLTNLRRLGDGPLIVKGVLSPADARLAADRGADGIVVSHHGGRTLDGALSPIDVLPQIADAVRDELTVLVDGGVRLGSDIVKALAHGVLLGRAPVWGTAVAR